MNVVSFSKGTGTLNTLGQIKKTEAARTTSISKIASSLKIRKASDAVADSAIGSKIKVQIESMKQLLVGTSMAAATLDIAEGSLNDMTGVLTRMSTLATSAKNGSYSKTDLDKINQEFLSLIDQVDRMAESTTFNSKPLLSGNSMQKYDKFARTNDGHDLRGNFLSKKSGIENIDVDNRNLNTGYSYSYDQSTRQFRVTDLNNKNNYESITVARDVIVGDNIETLNFSTMGVIVKLNSNFNKELSLGTDTRNMTNTRLNNDNKFNNDLFNKLHPSLVRETAAAKVTFHNPTESISLATSSIALKLDAAHKIKLEDGTELELTSGATIGDDIATNITAADSVLKLGLTPNTNTLFKNTNFVIPDTTGLTDSAFASIVNANLLNGADSVLKNVIFTANSAETLPNTSGGDITTTLSAAAFTEFKITSIDIDGIAHFSANVKLTANYDSDDDATPENNDFTGKLTGTFQLDASSFETVITAAPAAIQSNTDQIIVAGSLSKDGDSYNALSTSGMPVKVDPRIHYIATDGTLYEKNSEDVYVMKTDALGQDIKLKTDFYKLKDANGDLHDILEMDYASSTLVRNENGLFKTLNGGSHLLEPGQIVDKLGFVYKQTDASKPHYEKALANDSEISSIIQLEILNENTDWTDNRWTNDINIAKIVGDATDLSSFDVKLSGTNGKAKLYIDAVNGRFESEEFNLTDIEYNGTSDPALNNSEFIAQNRLESGRIKLNRQVNKGGTREDSIFIDINKLVEKGLYKNAGSALPSDITGTHTALKKAGADLPGVKDNVLFSLNELKNTSVLHQEFSDFSELSFQVGIGSGEENVIKVRIQSVTSEKLGLRDKFGDDDFALIRKNNTDSDINKVSELISKVILKLDSAIGTIQDVRTAIAVGVNGLEYANSNINTSITNSQAAVSAIFDLDIPSEMTELNQSELQEQSAIEVLAKDMRAKQNLMKLF